MEAERTLIVKVIALAAMFFAAGAILVTAVGLILFAAGWVKLAGLGLLLAGLALWGVTFWLIGGRPPEWAEPGRNRSRHGP